MKKQDVKIIKFNKSNYDVNIYELIIDIEGKEYIGIIRKLI